MEPAPLPARRRGPRGGAPRVPVRRTGTPATSPDAATYRDNVANALTDRYGIRGDEADLREAIAHYEGAADVAGAVDRRRICANLATTLLARYRSTGESSDLDRAVAMLDAVVADTGPSSPALATSSSRWSGSRGP